MKPFHPFPASTVSKSLVKSPTFAPPGRKAVHKVSPTYYLITPAAYDYNVVAEVTTALLAVVSALNKFLKEAGATFPFLAV